ncbi:hypothetical protein VNO78_18124 [Psophocarpus tetragonolobus]|uniref:Uncharacterized protein n=1 Tax=Psophocarpus tetragonolobus TaxID=3891 RepID=A0AAN9XLJ7_PSOTE
MQSNEKSIELHEIKGIRSGICALAYIGNTKCNFVESELLVMIKSIVIVNTYKNAANIIVHRFFATVWRFTILLPTFCNLYTCNFLDFPGAIAKMVAIQP